VVSARAEQRLVVGSQFERPTKGGAVAPHQHPKVQEHRHSRYPRIDTD
jgi:hypothetical protein